VQRDRKGSNPITNVNLNSSTMCFKCLYFSTLPACRAIAVLSVMKSNEIVDHEIILQMYIFWFFCPEKKIRHLQWSATSFSVCSSYRCSSNIISSFHIYFSFVIVFTLAEARILLTHRKQINVARRRISLI